MAWRLGALVSGIIVATTPTVDSLTLDSVIVNNHTPRERLLWSQAVAEEGLDPQKVSSWGKQVSKIPRSWVERIKNMDHTKFRLYNFQGSAFTPKQQDNRAWLFKFIKNNFDGETKCFLRFTDAHSNYTKMGKYDFTGAKLPSGGGFRPMDLFGLNTKGRNHFDEQYYQVMCNSKFTLCPGGETPWSMRMYEAVLAGSIPLIHNEDRDYSPPAHANWLKQIGYTYAKAHGSHEYRQEDADRNFQLFIKYQTFMNGDNTPEGIDPAAPVEGPSTEVPAETIAMVSRADASSDSGVSDVAIQQFVAEHFKEVFTVAAKNNMLKFPSVAGSGVTNSIAGSGVTNATSVNTNGEGDNATSATNNTGNGKQATDDASAKPSKRRRREKKP